MESKCGARMLAGLYVINDGTISSYCVIVPGFSHLNGLHRVLSDSNLFKGG